MEFKQLEVFVCVAKYLSFSKAAQALFISQPTVSAHINALEKHLGLQLLVRNTKEVCLTKAGVGFLIHAKNILSLRDRAVYETNPGKNNAKGVIDIICSTIPAQYLLPDIIASFCAGRENAVFNVIQRDSQGVQEQMKGFRYDFGLTGTLPNGDYFDFCPIYNDELVLALPKQVEVKDEIIRSAFKDFVCTMPFIMREAGSGTRTEIQNLLFKMDVNINDLNIVSYFSDANAILLGVSKGMGISLVPKIAAKMYAKMEKLRIVEMNNTLFHRRIYLIHNKELCLNVLQQSFRDFASRFYLKD